MHSQRQLSIVSVPQYDAEVRAQGGGGQPRADGPHAGGVGGGGSGSPQGADLLGVAPGGRGQACRIVLGGYGQKVCLCIFGLQMTV
jgi:hypothetical protein